MSVRVGASRRTRRGSVWISAPLGLVALAALLLWPLVLEYWLLKLSVLALAWGARELARAYRRTRQPRPPTHH